MRLPQVLRGRGTRRIASLTTLAVATAGVVVLAVTSEGQPIVDVSLNDGSVWVTNTNEGMAGRLNPSIGLLDLSVPISAPDTDVLQAAYDLLLHYPSGDEPSVQVVDVATAVAGSSIILPKDAKVSFGGGTVAILDPSTGDVFVRSMGTISGFTFKDVPPEVSLGERGLVAVSPQGVVSAFDVENGTVWSISVDEADVAIVAPQPLRLGAEIPAASTDLAATVVGSTPVVLDRTAGQLVWPAHPAVDLDLPADEEEAAVARLQQPSADAGTAYVATSTQLVAVDLEDGTARQLRDGPVSGAPAAPVVVDGCVHAAWADPEAEAYQRICGSDDQTYEIDGVAPDSPLTFRVNRDVVVLNDIRTGDSWLVRDDRLEKIDNWDDVNPTKGSKNEKDEEIDEDPDRSAPNVAPKANDDPDLGARAGQATILPITANDTDGNGDVLTVSDFSDIEGGTEMEGASLSVAGKGTELQLKLPPEAAGRIHFTYKIDDGQDSPQPSARVDVQIAGPDDNDAPQLLEDRITEMTVGSGKTSSVYVLPDWIDPNGDDLVLVNATTAGEGDRVEFDANGTVTFADSGERVGAKSIAVVVSDGQDETEGIVAVTVSPQEKLLPELVPDLAAGVLGTDVEVKPLINDQSPDGTPLTLSRVLPVDGLTITADLDTGTFVVRAQRPDNYYLTYKAFNGSGTATSYIRVDVDPASGANQRPVAVKDQGVMPAGGSVLVDLLANDYDANNDVLVVQSLDIPAGSGVKAVLVDKSQLRVEATKALVAPVPLSYTISDGLESDTGSVVITPGDVTVLNRAPVAEPDAVTVRAGGIASIPVLANDKDPDGGQIELEGDLVENSTDMLVFASGSLLRVRAPRQPGAYVAVYGIRDTDDRRDTAAVTVTVVEDTASGNRQPDLQPLVDRAFAGQPTRIFLDTTGVDPDGDAVAITGVVTPPLLGRVVSFGLDELTYEPRPDASGTDVFQIAVEDKYGGRDVVDVRVGVAARARVNQAPAALDDRLTVQPGRTIELDVRSNDRDPDGTVPQLVAEVQPADGVTASTTDGGFVSVEVPDGTDVVDHQVTYSVTDGIGGNDSAVLTVTADPDAPELSPLTRDDTADPLAILGREPGDTVEVPVLDNDGDLDGAVGDLVLKAIDGGTSSLSDDGRSLVVRLRKTSQVIAYEVRDADDNRSYAFVFVAGTDEIPPTLDATKIPVSLDQGTTKRLVVSQLVLTRSGRTPSVTRPGKVAAERAEDSATLVDGDVVFTPDPTFSGPSSVSIEVTDGKGDGDAKLNDPGGLLAQLTVPIDVVPNKNEPPTLQATRTQVESGAETAITLVGPADEETPTGLADDPNPGDLETLVFDVSKDDRIDAQIEGGQLLLSSTEAADPGDEVTLTLTATDAGRATVEAQVLIDVVSSTRPLVAVDTIEVTTFEDQPIAVDIAERAKNPFPNDDGDHDLIVSAPQVETDVPGDTDVSGQTVTITPTQPGVMSVTYVVNDYLGDPERAVLGRIRVQVLANPDPDGTGGGTGGTDGPDGSDETDPEDPGSKPTEEAKAPPGAPSKPRATPSSEQVTLTFDEPLDNGATIDGYKVVGSAGLSQSCPATTCTITGLTNNVAYTFTVQAHNSQGYGEASAASDPVTPRGVPGVMGAPQIATDPSDGKMNSQLTLSWDPPADVGGAPIDRYQLFNLNSAGQAITVTGTTTVVDGLQNGEGYAFKIQAVNSFGPSPLSDASVTTVPSGPPLFAVTPRATTPRDGTDGGKYVVVEWDPADPNGDAITGYRVEITPGAPVTVGAEVTSREFTSVTNGQDYTFEVTAINRAGETTSRTSNIVNPYGRANAPQGLRMTNEGDGTATVAWSPPSSFNGRPDSVLYRVSVDGNVVDTVSGTQKVIGGLANVAHSVTVQTITVYRGTQLGGLVSGAVTVRPFGQPGTPSINSSPGERSVNFSVGPPAANGRPITDVQWRTGGGGWQSLGPNGGNESVPVTYGGQSATIEARAISEGASPSQSLIGNTVSGTGTATAPIISVKVGDWSAANNGYYIFVDTTGLEPRTMTNAHFMVACTAGCPGAPPDSSALSGSDGEFYLRTGIGGRTYGGNGSVAVRVTQPNGFTITSGYVPGWNVRPAARAFHDPRSYL